MKKFFNHEICACGRLMQTRHAQGACADTDSPCARDVRGNGEKDAIIRRVRSAAPQKEKLQRSCENRTKKFYNFQKNYKV